MSQRARPGSRDHHRISLPAILGGMLWIPYGIFEMLQPWGPDTEYREDIGYEIVINDVLYRLYSLPGSMALLLTSIALAGIHRLSDRDSMRISRVLTYTAATLGVLSATGVISRFDPLFTAPRIFGTMVLGLAMLLTGMRLPRADPTSANHIVFMALGLLGLFLFPLWPLVHAVEIIPEWLGAVIIALFGLGWMLAGYYPWRRIEKPATRS